jgi:hypothetical protein
MMEMFAVVLETLPFASNHSRYLIRGSTCAASDATVWSAGGTMTIILNNDNINNTTTTTTTNEDNKGSSLLHVGIGVSRKPKACADRRSILIVV